MCVTEVPFSTKDIMNFEKTKVHTNIQLVVKRLIKERSAIHKYPYNFNKGGGTPLGKCRYGIEVQPRLRNNTNYVIFCYKFLLITAIRSFYIFSVKAIEVYAYRDNKFQCKTATLLLIIKMNIEILIKYCEYSKFLLFLYDFSKGQISVYHGYSFICDSY